MTLNLKTAKQIFVLRRLVLARERGNLSFLSFNNWQLIFLIDESKPVLKDTTYFGHEETE